MRRIDRAALRHAAGVGLVVAACLGPGVALAADPAPPPKPTQSELATARTAQSAQPTGARSGAAEARLATPQDTVAAGIVVPGVAATKVAAVATAAPKAPPSPRTAAVAASVPAGFAASGLKGAAAARSAGEEAGDPAAAGVVVD